MWSFSYQGCTLWNNLPGDIKHIQILHSFKAAVKAHFLENA